MPLIDAGSGDGGGGGGLNWPMCEDIPVIVEVYDDGGWVRIPTTEVTTYITREGAADINRLTEVKFPTEWRGKNVTQYIDAFDPKSQSAYDKARVTYRDHEQGLENTVQFGYIRGVGSAGKTGLMKLWVADPSTMLTAIPFSGQVTNTTVSTFLDQIITQFKENTIFEDIQPATSEGQQTLGDTNEADGAADWNINAASDTSGIDSSSKMGGGTQRNFKANRHTLKDALDWLTEVQGGYVYFEYEQGLKLKHDVTARHKLLKDSELGGTVEIRENDAIEEIMPTNTITVNGATGMSFGGLDLAFLPSKKFPQVTAEYPPLTERTGVTIQPPIVNAKATSIKSAKEVAKRKLKEKLQSHGEGDITCKGHPNVDIFDRLRAYPKCQKQMTTGKPFDFEVQGVTHNAKSGNYTTNLNVTTYVDYGKIEITNANMKKQ